MDKFIKKKRKSFKLNVVILIYAHLQVNIILKFYNMNLKDDGFVNSWGSNKYGSWSWSFKGMNILDIFAFSNQSFVLLGKFSYFINFQI